MLVRASGAIEFIATVPALRAEDGIDYGVSGKCYWNRKKTAQTLSVNRTTLWRKMKPHGITM